MTRTVCFKNFTPDLGIDLVNDCLAHLREMSRLISKQARIASETKHNVDAVANVHGVPTTHDPTSMMVALRTKKAHAAGAVFLRSMYRQAGD